MNIAKKPGTVAGSVLLALAGLLSGCSGGGDVPVQEPGEDSNRVVARVDGRPISARQIERVVQAGKLRRMARSETVTEADEQTLRREALDLLISGEVLHAAAEAAGLRASTEEIDDDLTILKSQFADEEAYQEYLREAGLDEAFVRHEAGRRILMAAYVATLTDDLVIDDAAARSIYEQQREDFKQEERVRAAQILTRVVPDDPPDRRAAARAKIEEARGRLRAGEPFDEVAREYSESPFADRGGDLGYFARGRAVAELEQVVFSTPVGETTEIFETPHGFNIVKVLDRRAAGIPDFEEMRTGLMMMLAREQRDLRLREHVQGLRAAAEIRILDPELQPVR